MKYFSIKKHERSTLIYRTHSTSTNATCLLRIKNHQTPQSFKQIQQLRSKPM